MIKFSPYLDNIYRAVEAHNQPILQKAKIEYRRTLPTPERWKANLPWEIQKTLPLWSLPSRQELLDKFGGKFEWINILAKIGHEGKEVHKVKAEVLPTVDGYILWAARSHCGSQRWSYGSGLSPIFAIASDDLSKVTCDKCLGIRVKGGKDAGKPVTQYKCGKCGFTDRMGEFRSNRMSLSCPSCRSLNVSRVPGTGPGNRVEIDPYSRPREFAFDYKADYVRSPGCQPNLGNAKHETIRGMTEEEARQKLIKRETGGKDPWYSRIYDLKVTAIYAWNGNPLWRLSSNLPKPEEPKPSATDRYRAPAKQPLVITGRKKRPVRPSTPSIGSMR